LKTLSEKFQIDKDGENFLERALGKIHSVLFLVFLKKSSSTFSKRCRFRIVINKEKIRKCKEKDSFFSFDEKNLRKNFPFHSETKFLQGVF